MAYNILLLEKTQPEYEKYARDYGSLQNAVSVTTQMLTRGGHRVSCIFDLLDLTEDLYSAQDVVMLHPTIPKFRRVMQFRGVYPRVGLIITTGSGEHDREMHGLAQDGDGLYFLEKPFAMATLLETIDMAVRQSARRIEEKLS